MSSMGKTDKRVDAYIARSAEFAQPILEHWRELVHKHCPEVEETIKWGFPHFDYHGMMCSMASFKKHCAFTFWKGAMMSDPLLKQNAIGETAMGHLGRIESMDDLPSDKVMVKFLKEAMKLNEAGTKVEKPKPAPKKAIPEPDYFLHALKKNKAAKATYEGFSPSNKREYMEWITEAKTEATRDKRVAQALEWMSEGKPRNWKYMKK